MLERFDRRFTELEASRAALLAELRARPAGEIERQPSADSWSMRQVAEHLMLVEEAFLEHSRRKGVLRPAGLKQKLKRRLLKVFFGLRMRVKAPSTAVLPGDELSLDAIEERWAAARETLRSLLDEASAETAEQARFLHPIAGPLTLEQYLEFLADHHAHHRRQLQRIEASLAA